MRKGVACLVLIAVLLCTCALPCFAAEPRHLINLYFPTTHYLGAGNGASGANDNWVVEYELYDTYDGFPFVDYDSDYMISVVQTNEYNFQFQDFESETVVTVWLVDAPTDTKMKYTYTESNINWKPDGVQIRENGVVYPLVEELHEMRTDGSWTEVKSWSFRYVVEKGKSTTLNLWLHVPMRDYNYDEDIKTDQEIIDDLHNSLGDIDFFGEDAVRTVAGFADATDMLFDMWYVEMLCGIVLGIAAMGFVLYGKR